MLDTTPRQTLSRAVSELNSFKASSLISIISEIPGLDLNGHYLAPSPAMSASPTDADFSGPSSRRTSISSIGRASGSGRSSRSTSFNLPNEATHEIRADSREPGEEVEFGEEMDEESRFSCLHRLY